MDDTVVIGTKDFQVPKYFNFADVIDEWAQKEKVTMCFISMFCPTSLFVCLFVYLFFFSNVAQLIILVFLIVVNNTSSEPAWGNKGSFTAAPFGIFFRDSSFLRKL